MTAASPCHFRKPRRQELQHGRLFEDAIKARPNGRVACVSTISCTRVSVFATATFSMICPRSLFPQHAPYCLISNDYSFTRGVVSSAQH